MRSSSAPTKNITPAARITPERLGVVVRTSRGTAPSATRRPSRRGSRRTSPRHRASASASCARAARPVGATTAPNRIASQPHDRRQRERDPERDRERRSRSPPRLRARCRSCSSCGVRRELGAEAAGLGADVGRDLGRRRRARSTPPIIVAISRICSGPMPAVVTAAVPSRSPLVTNGFSGSFGIAFLLHVIPARSSASCATLPVTPNGRRSTSIRWLSVPPDTMRKPSAGERVGERAAR